MRCHAGAAARAASTASRTSSGVALCMVPRTASLRCGWMTSMASPPPARCSPPMVMDSSTDSAATCFRRASSAARSGLPGAKVCMGSLTGGGTWVTASNMTITLRVSWTSPTGEGPQEEQQVGRALRHPACEVGVPGRTERDVDADPVSLVHELLLEVAADPVQELELEFLRSPACLGRRLAHVGDQLVVVRAERGIRAVLEQPVGEVLELRPDLLLPLLGGLDRLGVCPLDQPDPGLERRKSFQVQRRATQRSLDGQPRLWVCGGGVPEERERVRDQTAVLHVDLDADAQRLGPVEDLVEVRHARVPVHGLAQLGELDGDC